MKKILSIIILTVVIVVAGKVLVKVYKLKHATDVPRDAVSLSSVTSFEAGDYDVSIMHDGIERWFLIHVPESLQEPAPLVFNFHGGGVGPSGWPEESSMSLRADEHGFVVVYPAGTNKNWNDGRVATKELTQNADDIGFVSSMIDELSARISIDETRVYATGISNGGQISYRLACDLANRIAAIAPISSGMGEDVLPNCTPSETISALIMQGSGDPILPALGGEGTLGRGKIVPVLDVAHFWAEHNQCTTETTDRLPDTDPSDGTSIIKTEYGGCADGTAVQYFEIQNGGHTWPGGTQYLPESSIGLVSKDIDASKIIWEFFEQHTR